MIEVEKFFNRIHRHRKKCEECLELYAGLIEYLTNAEIALNHGKIEEFTKYLDEVDRQSNLMCNKNCIYPDTRQLVHEKTDLLRDFVKIKLRKDALYQQFLNLKYVCTSELIGVISDLCRQIVKCL